MHISNIDDLLKVQRLRKNNTIKHSVVVMCNDSLYIVSTQGMWTYRLINKVIILTKIIANNLGGVTEPAGKSLHITAQILHIAQNFMRTKTTTKYQCVESSQDLSSHCSNGVAAIECIKEAIIHHHENIDQGNFNYDSEGVSQEIIDNIRYRRMFNNLGIEVGDEGRLSCPVKSIL